MARISLRPQTQVVLEWKARTLELRIVPGCSTCRRPKRPTVAASRCRLPEDWHPSSEDRIFAWKHGMNPKGVAHALRNNRDFVSGATVDKSALFRDWIKHHAIEAPIIFPLF